MSEDTTEQLAVTSDFGDDIRKLLIQITPEKSKEVEELCEGVTFREDNDNEGIAFEAVSNWKYVRIAMRCQFRLWAHCYSYWVLFLGFNAKRTPDTSKHEVTDADLKLADDLLEWAVSADITIRQQQKSRLPVHVPEPPTDMPLPFEGLTLDIVSKGAEEIFKHSLAFIIHHELGHISCKHQGAEGELSIEQEFEADAFAADWLLGDDSVTEFEYLCRQVGVAIALIWFTSLAFREKYEKKTHPPAWRRLVKVFESTVKDEVAAIWGFIGIALSAHFGMHGLSLSDLSDFAPTKSNVNEMVEMIEARNSSLETE